MADAILKMKSGHAIWMNEPVFSILFYTWINCVINEDWTTDQIINSVDSDQTAPLGVV